MRAEIEWGDRPIFVVTLSRRNLRSLLAKLDGEPPDSACTIVGGHHADGVIVKAEEDNVHYASREPGVMHPSTEKALENQ